MVWGPQWKVLEQETDGDPGWQVDPTAGPARTDGSHRAPGLGLG